MKLSFLLDKSLLEVVKKIPKERSPTVRDAHDLDEIKSKSVRFLLVNGLLRGGERDDYGMSGLVDVEQEGFSTRALVMTATQGLEMSGLVNSRITFHIAALTASGTRKLAELGDVNVHLYPGISLKLREFISELLYLSGL